MLIGKLISGLFPLLHSRFIKDNCRLIIKHCQCESRQLYCKLMYDVTDR